MMLDLPSTIVTLTFAGKYKEVVDYLGTPKSLRDLEKKIDTAVNSKRWVNIDSETVREKCRQGWDINGKEGKSLLLHAAGDGEAEVVRTFIAEGANVRNPADSISLLQNARGKEVFEALISAGADVSAKSDTKWGWYPPMSGPARMGDPDSIRVLIEAGATVDIGNHNGTTALMVAAEKGVPESVRLLLSAGADEH